MRTSLPASPDCSASPSSANMPTPISAKPSPTRPLLTREMSHRVKNSLTSVVGLLRVQARSAQSEDVKHALEDASARVETIAQVHDHLWRGSQIGFVDLADFMTELSKKLKGATG